METRVGAFVLKGDAMLFAKKNKSLDSKVSVELARKVCMTVFAQKYGWLTRSRSNRKSANRLSELDREVDKALKEALSSQNVDKYLKKVDSEYSSAVGGGNVVK